MDLSRAAIITWQIGTDIYIKPQVLCLKAGVKMLHAMHVILKV